MKPADGTHRGIGHQRRKRTINRARIDEQEYPDGSVTVFVDNVYYAGTFEDAISELTAKENKDRAV